MIKDLIVNLSVAGSRDVAGPYAISIAETFDAHAAAVAFRYDAVIPATIIGGGPASLIDQQRADNDQAASDALARFDAAAKREGISFETRVMNASVPGAADMFGALARRFDLSVVAQGEPGKVAPEEVIVEAALFSSGRPVLVVPYIQKTGVKLDRTVGGGGGRRKAARAGAGGRRWA